MEQTYEQQLQADLDAARLRVEQAIAAGNFLSTPEGKLVQDWVNLRVSLLIEKMTGKVPADDRDYLAYHGAVKELKEFNVMLQSKASQLESAQEEVNVLNEQQKAISGQSAIDF